MNLTDNELQKLADALPKEKLIEILLAARSIGDGGFIELRLIYDNLNAENRARVMEAARDLCGSQSD
jgi:hypothetical protein